MKPESVAISIALMGFVIAIRLQEGIYRGTLLGLGRQVAINVAYALFATVRYVGAVAVLHYGSANIVTFFAWQVLVSVLSLIVLAILANRYLPTSDRPQRFSLESIVSVWRFSAGMAIVAGLSIAMANLDKLILSGVLPLDEFGRYALAAAAAGVLYLFVVPITQGFYPHMVDTHTAGDRVALIRLHHTCSQLVTVSAGSMAIVLIMFAKPILYVWSGNAELANVTSPLLAILAAAALANCLGYIGHNLKLVKGTPGILAVTGTGAMLLTLVVLPTVADKYGLFGGALAWLGIAVLQAGLLLVLAHKGNLQGEGLRWLTMDTALPLLGAAAIAWLLSCYTPELEIGGRLVLAIFLLVTTCVTFATGTLLAPDLRVRVRSFLIRKGATC
jgi:O-antigen/teichoic acid export membrane protein